jgi:hypothetical protein
MPPLPSTVTVAPRGRVTTRVNPKVSLPSPAQLEIGFDKLKLMLKRSGSCCQL